MSEKRVIRRRNWTDEEIKILIRSWSDHHNELICIRRNRSVYDKIAEELSMYGYTRESSEIQLKIKNLSAHYRKEKHLQATSPSYHIEWKYFEPVGRILNSLFPDSGSLARNSLKPVPSSDSFQEELECEHCDDEYSESVESDQGSSNPASPGTTLHLNLSPDGNLAIKDRSIELSLKSGNISKDNTSNSQFSVEAQVPNHILVNSKNSKTIESMFEDLVREFRETNKSIKETDLLLRNLLQENNDLIKQQNEYILKLLNK